MTIASIIVTYNGERWIRKCLDSIFKSDIKSLVIVVDNCSADKTVSIVRFEFPDCILTCLDENIGFGKANNVGISLALEKGASFIFLLNQDAFIMPDTFEKLLKASNKNADYGILSPIHLASDGNSLDFKFTQYLEAKVCPQFINDAFWGKLEDIYSIEFVNAAAWLIPKQVLLKVGGFNPLFHVYGEDVEYCRRVRYHGYKIGVITNAYIIHERMKADVKLILNNSTILNTYFNRKMAYLTDYNKSFIVVLINSIAEILKKSILSLCKMEFLNSFYYLLMVFRIWLLAPKLTSNRALVKKEGAWFLNDHETDNKKNSLFL